MATFDRTAMKEKAKAGDLKAMFELGMLYRDEPQFDKYIALIDRSAKGGYAPAQYEQGRYQTSYSNCTEEQEEQEEHLKNIEYLGMAADQGDVKAQWHLHELLKSDKWPEDKDIEKADMLHRMVEDAAEKGRFIQ